MKHSVSSTFLRYLRLSNALQGTFFLEKDDFFHKNFKLVHAPTLSIHHYMVCDVFIYTQREAFCLVMNIVFSLSAIPSCLVRYIILEKDDFS